MTAVSLAPHVPENARLLILGSLPGAASLVARKYYAHPRNLFWRLLGEVVEEDLVSPAYEARLQTLAAHRIGLWDVVKSAERRGSLDAAIRNAFPNDLQTLAGTLPDLKAVAFSGVTAHNIGRKYLTSPGLTLVCLPSSSPAHAAMPFETKRDAWLALRAFL